ncbi:unnamed protein product [Prunus armeniaca]
MDGGASYWHKAPLIHTRDPTSKLPYPLSLSQSHPRPKPSFSSRSREPDLVAVLRGLGGRSGLAKWRSGMGFLRDKVVMWAGSGGGGAVEKMMTLDFD